MDWTKVYYPLTVGPRAGDPLGSDFADEQTVTGTAHVLLSSRSIFNWRGLVTDSTLDHVLVDLSLHRDEVLTDSAADDGGRAALRGGEGGVRGRILPQQHRGRCGARERRETLGFVGVGTVVGASQSSIPEI